MNGGFFLTNYIFKNIIKMNEVIFLNITKQNNLKLYQQILSVIAGACLMGFMWRARGSHGFGAKWGMFAVAFVFMLFIYALYGKRKKMNYEMLPLPAVLAALTAVSAARYP